jgi:hypothetical protein
VGFYTDWFLADESDAEAVASITTTEESSFEDWPHLSLKGIAEMDLSALWGILRGEPDSLDSATGDLLFQEGDEVFVCRVEPGFVAALAAVKPAAIKRWAAEWNKTEGLADWGAAEVVGALRELVKFAARAKREGKPVLQLSVL